MLAVSCGAFFLFGIVLVLVGANQDVIAADLGLNLAQSGFLGAVIALGAGLGNFASGPLVDRFPRRPLFAACTALMAFALLTTQPGLSYPRLLVHVACVGFGGGFYDILLNIIAVERYERQAARLLAFLHAVVTVGAIAGPALILWFTTRGGWVYSFRALGVSFAALTLWVLATPLGPPPRRPHPEGGHGRGAGLFSPCILALCVVGFAYIGVELSMTIFAVPYASDGLGLDPDRGRRAISAFWFGLLVGRVLMMLYRGEMDARWLSVGGLAAGTVILVGVAAHVTALDAMVGLMGLAVGGVFPLMVVLTARAVPHAAGTATGIVVGIGAMGGFLLPWFTGFLGDHLGIRIAVGSFAVWWAVLAVAALVAYRTRPRT